MSLKIFRLKLPLIELFILAVMLSHVGWFVRLESANTLAEAMYHLLSKNCDNPGSKLGKIVNILMKLQTILSNDIPLIEHSILVNFPGIVHPERHKFWCEITGLRDVAQSQCTDTYMDLADTTTNNTGIDASYVSK